MLFPSCEIRRLTIESRFLVILLVVLGVIVAPLVAESYTHTIVVRCVVREVQPVFAVTPDLAVVQVNTANLFGVYVLSFMTVQGVRHQHTIVYRGYTPPRLLFVLPPEFDGVVMSVERL